MPRKLSESQAVLKSVFAVPTMKLYQVEDFEVSLDHREVRRNGEPLRLRPMTFDLLAYLISQRDKVLSKEELIRKIWKGIRVRETSLMQWGGELRKARDDDPRQQRFIKTVAKTGYRFVGPVEEIPALRENILREETP